MDIIHEKPPLPSGPFDSDYGFCAALSDWHSKHGAASANK